MAGASCGILIAWAAGLLLKHFAALEKVEMGYEILFVVCGLAYVTAWMVMHFLVPKMKRVEI
jgi:MFS transporter, ACS family, hexuronate transporter